jgi:hypothetical protein
VHGSCDGEIAPLPHRILARRFCGVVIAQFWSHIDPKQHKYQRNIFRTLLNQPRISRHAIVLYATDLVLRRRNILNKTDSSFNCRAYIGGKHKHNIHSGAPLSPPGALDGALNTAPRAQAPRSVGAATKLACHICTRQCSLAGVSIPSFRKQSPRRAFLG